ncbi:MAG: hypothetical protein EA361_04825 [Bacteroidetes bacterium]|nr:MAG: hypothetical protein EA361_04825 [Bacteroidota bacterium]
MSKYYFRFTLFLFFFANFHVAAQDTIRVMQYNLLFYGYYTDFCTPENNNTDQKDQYLRTILGQFQPDIFAVNEMGRGAHNVTRLRDNALNVDGVDYFEHATYTNSTNSWFANALYYDSRKFGLYNETVPSSTLRDINLYTLYYKTEDLAVTGDTTFLTCIVAHLKAGQSASDQQTRTAMVNNVMAYLHNNNYSGNILFMGDFNMKSSFEQAYQRMVAHSNPDIRFYDPIDVSGVWGHNPDMAPYHTQSPRTGSHPCFVTGGLDDRYDFILASNSIMQGLDGFHYVEDSYTTIGQDGIRYNQSLISPPNYSQPQEIISALYNMSDHLPVMMDMVVTTPLSTPDIPGDFDLSVSFQNPVKDRLKLEIQNDIPGEIKVRFYALTGLLAFEQSFYKTAGNAFFELELDMLPSGIYLMQVELTGGAKFSGKVVKL